MKNFAYAAIAFAMLTWGAQNIVALVADLQFLLAGDAAEESLLLLPNSDETEPTYDEGKLL